MTDNAPVTDNAPEAQPNPQQPTTQTPSSTTTHVEKPEGDKGPTIVQKEPNGEAGDAFVIPDAYKDKPWSKLIKNQDELWKQIDGLQEMRGKKTVRDLPDFANSTPEQLEEFYATTRPESADVYKFPEGVDVPEDEAKAVRGILHKYGIPEHVGTQILADYSETQKGVAEGFFDKDKFEGMLKTSFGNDWEKVAGRSAASFKEHLNADDQAMLEKIPNEFLSVMYRYANAMLEAHGVKESGAGGDAPPTQIGGKDVTELRKELRAKINDLDKRSHTAAEKQALIDQLDATYRTNNQRRA